MCVCVSTTLASLCGRWWDTRVFGRVFRRHNPNPKQPISLARNNAHSRKHTRTLLQFDVLSVIWQKEFFALVKERKPVFVALHIQELGGKEAALGMRYVDLFIE